MNDIRIALENGASLDDMPLIIKKEKAWCKVHPLGFIGKDQFDNWYATCMIGKRKNEECEIVIERGNEKHG